MRTALKRAGLSLLLASAGCGNAGGETAGRAQGGCSIVQRTLALPDGLAEGSGVAWSRSRPGAFWSHNDSGGLPELFLVATSGRGSEQVAVPGAAMNDWEDMAMAPCADGHCLIIADIGDNRRRQRDPIALYAFPEPVAGETRTAPARTYTAEYPDGAGRDAEAIFALPDGSIYLITKGDAEPVQLYRWPTPLVPDTAATLELVRNLGPAPEETGDQVTGASATPNGRFVAVRTYAMLAIYRTEVLLAGGEPALRVDLSLLQEGQGEGVAIADDGNVVLVSESGTRYFAGTAALLRCQLPSAAPPSAP